MASEWHAAEALNEALEKTNELLFRKFNLAFWLKLAVVVFLVGGSGGFNFNTGFGGSDKDKNMAADFTAILPFLVVIFAVVIIIALIFMFIKAVCQFMFIETVGSGEIELVKGFKRNVDAGFNLFLFELGLLLVSLVLLVVTLGPLIYLLVKGGLMEKTIPLLIAIVAGIIVCLIIAIIMSLVTMLTNDFALVIAHAEKKGIIAGWRRLWRLMNDNIKQFGVYVLVKIALAILAGIILTIIGIIAFIIALIPVAVVGVAFVVALIVLSAGLGVGKGVLMLLVIPAVIIGIVYFIAISYCIVVITLPVPVFFRCYSILFLQRIEPGIRVTAGKRLEKERKKEPPMEEKKRLKAKAKKTVKSEKKLRVY